MQKIFEQPKRTNVIVELKRYIQVMDILSRRHISFSEMVREKMEELINEEPPYIR